MNAGTLKTPSELSIVDIDISFISKAMTQRQPKTGQELRVGERTFGPRLLKPRQNHLFEFLLRVAPFLVAEARLNDFAALARQPPREELQINR
jgi:hypothetical protein